jgi:hypothetical protein
MRKTSVRPAPREAPRHEPKAAASETFAAEAPPPSSSSSTVVRGAIDSLVQGSLVELFQAYSVALAPQPRSARDPLPKMPEICAWIGFSHGTQKRSGKLSLSLSPAVVGLMKVEVASTRQIDWARELCNQLMGRIKNRMLQFNVRLQAGLPSSIDPKLLEDQLKETPTARIYAGRTLRGDVVVTLDGMPHETELVYVGPANVANEGEAIFF